MEKDTKKPAKLNAELIRQLEEQINKIQYGSVTAVIHDGRVVQIDTSSKIRLI
ncbi:MAG: YezD family protein [Lachnospiraceae bacterium]|nr:YezD family protein [Lachnospiraceae bacterium]